MTARVRTLKPSPCGPRSGLMLSCAVAAILAAGASQQARAQAFQGNESVVGGVATRTITGSTTETITIGSSTATINWSPYDVEGSGTIDFLPAGNTATFTNDPSATSTFTVLNRILPLDPSRPIALNGHLISQLQDLSQNVTTGGNVWFYSPGGIVVGSSAVFDVGGILLSANDPINFATSASGFSGQFVSSPSSTAMVQVQSGAQINATAGNSYVALIAPRVEQNGAVRVDGSAAFVAAQDVTMTMNQGLFDIQVNLGTDDPNGIVHTGSTTGPASGGDGDNHRIYMVAVPKNQALTALLSGTAGFDAASDASIENGMIVLSAGYSVNGVGGDAPGDSLFGANNDDGAQPVSASPADFHIDGGHYTSDLIGRASNNLFASSTTQSTSFDGDVILIGANAAHINARNGNSITIGGNATVTNGMSDPYHDRSSEGGEALLNAESGSTLTIAGNATVDAAARGGANLGATGGTATLSAAGGTISIGGNVTVDASGYGGATGSGDAGASGHGGSALVLANAGGSLHVGGDVAVLSGALSGINQAGTTAASSIGGASDLIADGGDIAIDGSATLYAGALGGASFNGGASGDATGGSASAEARAGGELIVGGQLNAIATATGGTASGVLDTDGGNATGGHARVRSNDGTLSAGSIGANANAYGGAGIGAGDGGAAQGGQANVEVLAGTLSATGLLNVTSSGFGGTGQAGGAGQGGLAEVYSQDGTIAFDSAIVASSGAGGSGAVGGRGAGGIPADPNDTTAPDFGAFVSARNGTISGRSLSVVSTGTGGASSIGSGGNGIGGFGAVTALNGTSTSLIDVDHVSMDSSGFGGTGGAGAAGGIGEGGAAHLLARAVNGSLAVDDAQITAIGAGGAGGDGSEGSAGGAGGAGYGGFTNFGTSSGNPTTTDRNGIATFGSVSVNLNGIGGHGGSSSGAAGGVGGVGIGGSGTLLARGSTVHATSVGMVANGYGGAGGTGFGGASASGGLGIGGNAGLLATNFFQGTAPATVEVGSFAAMAAGLALDPAGPTQAGAVSIESIDSSVTLGSVTMAATGAQPRNFSGTDAFGDAFTLSPGTSGMNADGGTINVTGSAAITSGSNILIATAGGGEIGVGGTLSASGTSVRIAADPPAQQSTSQAGDFSIDAGNLAVSSTGDVAVDGVGVGDTASFNYAGDLTLGDLSAGESIVARLASQLDPEDAVHALLIDGQVSAPSISLESGTIDIASDGSLGEFGVTDTLELIARSFGQPVILGGPDQTGDAPGQYHLTQASASRIDAANVRVRATSNGSELPRVVIRDLTIQGSQGEGASSVELSTAGSVRVEGELSYIDAAASDALRIIANQRLEVITPDGSIRMVDSSGALSGTLTLQSSNVVITDAQLAQRLSDNSTFEGRDAALATNSGAVNPAGYVQAGGIRLLTDHNIFIQNTGTATQFAGLTVGGQGLLVGRYQSGVTSDGLQTFSFTGTLTTANDVLRFDFTITAESQITLRTYSYAGGTNGDGLVVPSGGFDPILALFNAAGELIGQNDDGGQNVPADPNTGSHYDTFFQALLPAGNYTVTVMAYSNFANGPNLSDGFEGGGSFNGRTPNFAFDVIGADSVTGPGASSPITVIGYGRRQNPDGSFTNGNAFFGTVNFGTSTGVEYAAGSTFNSCPITAGCAVTPPPPDPEPEPEPQPQPEPSPSPTPSAESVLGPVEVVDAGTDPSDPDPATDEGSVIVMTALALTGGAAVESGLLEEAVVSGGDTTLWIPDDPQDDEEEDK